MDFSYVPEYEFQISQWLSTAVENKVEHVVLCSDVDEEVTIVLPKSMYNCSALITLELDHCLPLKISGVVEWKSLKTLKLKCIKLDDDDIVNLLSGCSALETLELFSASGFRRLEITSSNLKRLKFGDYWLPDDDDVDHSLEIFAPYIQHLDIYDDLFDLKCRLVNVSSVVSARLTFRISCTSFTRWTSDDNCPNEHQVIRTLVQEYFQKLRYATELTIGTWFTQVLLQFEGLPLPELKCKYLTLDLHFTELYFYGAAILLGSSPHVETLSITMATTIYDHYQCDFDSEYLAKENNIGLLSWISSFEFPNLKNVKIVYSSGVCLKDLLERGYVNKLFKLSELLLKNAKFLDKFSIISKRRKCESCSMNCVSRCLFQLAEKLLDCPRSSTNSVISFQE